MVREKRLVSVDLLRVLAIYAVIIVHVVHPHMQLNIHEYEWIVASIYGSAVRWCVPVILMISGMFFLEPENKLSVSKLYKKYIFRIVMAYLFWSAMYVIFPVNNNLVKNLIHEFDVLSLLSEFLRGRYHLQFLHYLLALYVLVPFLRAITARCSQRMLSIYLLIWFVFTMCPPVVDQFFSYKTIKEIMSNMNLSAFTGWNIGYFIAGYYFKKYVPGRKWERSIYFIGVMAIIFTCYGTIHYSFVQERPFRLLWGYKTPNIALIAISIFVFFEKQISKINFKDKTEITIFNLSKHSFGVYLIHDFFVQIIKISPIDTQTINPILSIPLVSLIIFVCSYMFTAAIFKFTKYSRYIL